MVNVRLNYDHSDGIKSFFNITPHRHSGHGDLRGALDIKLLVPHLETLKVALTGDYEPIKKAEELIQRADLKISLEPLHIKADWVKDNRVTNLTKPQYISQEQKNLFSDYLLENFETELRANDIRGLLKGLESRRYMSSQKDIVSMCDPGFLYAYF